MLSKTKISIVALIVGSFITGGLVFSAYQVGAFGGGHMLGFFKGGCDLNGLEKDSPEWQAKIEECKAERKAKMEERKAEMETWKDMTPEERQAKLEELKANWPQNGEWKGRGFGFGPFMGLRGFKGMPDEVNYEIKNIDNGVQITITSDNSEIAQKLQEWAARYSR